VYVVKPHLVGLLALCSIYSSMALSISYNNVIPSTIPRYSYQGIQQCLENINQESERYEREESEGPGISNPYVIMDIGELSFLECFVNSGEKLETPYALMGD
jgi:hypothetical protein